MFVCYIFVMNRISFKANLVIDNKLYTKMPEGTPEHFSENLLAEYKKFIEHPVISEMTEGDTIYIYKKPYNKGFALGLDFESDKLPSKIEGGIHTNKKIPDVKPREMIFQTMLFIIVKFGTVQKFSERTRDTFIRTVKEFYENKKKQSSE